MRTISPHLSATSPIVILIEGGCGTVKSLYEDAENEILVP